MAVFKGAGCKFNTFTQRGALNTTCVLRLRFVTAAAKEAAARALEREREFLERRAAEATKEKENACR
jgi:hypothetical protein